MERKTIVVTLDLPDVLLSPNKSRGRSWQATHKAKKKAYHDAYYATLAAGAARAGFTREDRLAARWTFYHSDSRKRDWDNLVGVIKPVQDGMVKALGIDDSQFDDVLVSKRHGKASIEVKIVSTKD